MFLNKEFSWNFGEIVDAVEDYYDWAKKNKTKYQMLQALVQGLEEYLLIHINNNSHNKPSTASIGVGWLETVSLHDDEGNVIDAFTISKNGGKNWYPSLVEYVSSQSLDTWLNESWDITWQTIQAIKAVLKNDSTFADLSVPEKIAQKFQELDDSIMITWKSQESDRWYPIPEYGDDNN